MKRLPDPVDAVEHSVVEEESRVVDGGVQVGGIAAHGVVTGCVETEEAVWVAALDLGPEPLVCPGALADGHVQQVGRGVPFLGNVGAQVSA